MLASFWPLADLPLFPVEASAQAYQMDLLYWFLTVI